MKSLPEKTEHRDGFQSSLTDEGRYRLLIEAITDYAIYMLDASGYVSSWNPGARRFKGYEAKEIIGQHFSRFYTAEDKEKDLPARALEIARREGRFEGEGWRVRKDGSKFWVHVIIDPIRNSNGDVVAYAKITRDLTERKLAEEKRQAAEKLARGSEEQFKLLVQGVTDYAIYMLDPNGIITNWNAGAQHIKGYKPEEIIGQHFSRFYGEEDRKNGEPQKGLATALREGKFAKEGWRYRKDGTRFWANVVIDPIRNNDGSLLGFAKITRDMTERRDAEIALEWAREAMAQSQKLETIGQLTGGVAHDFNNLLMAVLGSLELIRRRIPDEPKIKMLLNNAFEGARRGVALTQRMLAFARRQELTLTNVEIRDLIHGMTELMDRTLGPLITVEIAMPNNLPPVNADANQLETAVLNLAVNARDAMPMGGNIKIAARVTTVDTGSMGSLAAGKYVRLSVADTGSGMDPETLKRAIEPFFTTKGVGKGTGLGLSLVHGMAEQLGGRVTIESQKGKGTTAEIWLRSGDASVASNEDVGRETAANNSMRPLVVVAVDDDKLVLNNTVAMLQEFGHYVIEATSAQSALASIRSAEHVDLVITDQAMPQMTGSQLAEAIKAEWPGIPILLVTGYAELPEGAKSNLSTLAKPFSIDDLENAIANLVAGKQPEGPQLGSSYRR